MKVENYEFPKSSFLSIEKDFAIIIKKLLNNSRLQKLLYYKTKNALSLPDLNKEQQEELLSNNIKITPNINLNNTINNYLAISFDDFSPNGTNPEFRDNVIIFDIICHVDLWNLSDYQLRPYKIAGEIDSMLDNKRLTGIGKTQFKTCQRITVAEDYVALILVYDVIHGEEDKQEMLNPIDWENFTKVFNNEHNNE